MSMHNEQENWLVDMQSDLDWFIAEKNWKEALMVVDAVREQGYEHEADLMRKSCLRAQSEHLDALEGTRKDKVMRAIHENFISATEDRDEGYPHDYE